MKQTTFEEFVDLAKRATFVPVVKELVADLLTPVSAFLKVAEHSDYAFLLESVEGGEHVGRYSFLGKDPFMILRGHDGRTVIEKAGVNFRLELPHVAFHRHVGEFKDVHASPTGIVLTDPDWAKMRDKYLPSKADGDFIEALMKPVTEPGKFAGWISPPKVGIDNKPGDFEYVRIAA